MNAFQNGQVLYYKDTTEKEQEITLQNLLGKGKFDVFLASSDHSEFAIKIFPLNHYFYRKESRLINLEHKNICSPKKALTAYLKDTDRVENYSVIVSENCSNGDFFRILQDLGIKFEEKLARTYFHQLVNAVEFLHNQGIAHLDLSISNIVLDSNYQLKIIDFDAAAKEGDQFMNYLGTKNFRAPETRTRGNMIDIFKLDIYAMGVILFVMNAGFWAYQENTKLEDFLFDNNQLYWDCIETVQRKRKEIHFSPELKSLFISMTKKESKDRASFTEIKNSNWYREEIYSDEELFSIMKTKINEAEY